MGTGGDRPDQCLQARGDSDNGIAETKRGEAIGRLFRDKVINEGLPPPVAVPSKEQCREWWDLMDLGAEYGDDQATESVAGCLNVPYFRR
ncbi:hypothetical protein ACGFN1_28350 [Streptomyces sp. NPDC048685]|uniref:hypothetical protein n=1 Tax=Streptomyces sp. NPDC048685 TaxID=3365584 RepID=UPI003723C83A